MNAPEISVDPIPRPQLENLLSPSYRRRSTRMTQSRLADLHNLSNLARAVGVPAEYIQQYADADNQLEAYEQLRIPKKGKSRRGQFRDVYAAKEEWLAQLHRGVAMMTLNSVEFGDHVQGFIKYRSIRTNAKLHLAADEILHADIKSFFDSIKTVQVSNALVSVGVPKDMATLIAKACTINGFLRQGTRCSPILANLVCRSLDSDMLSLAKSTNSVYSRYADDLTFSGAKTPASDSVNQLLELHGFSLRDGRCYIQRRGRSQFVTGLNVTDPKQPRLPSRLKARLRLVMHHVELRGLKAHFSRDDRQPLVRNSSELWGMLRFAHSIEPAFAAKLFAQYAKGELIDERIDHKRMTKRLRLLRRE